MENSENLFPNRLKYFRKLANLTQAELGSMVGVSASTISMYESGERKPQLETIYDFSDALDVPINSLIPGFRTADTDKQVTAITRKERTILLGYRRASGVDQQIMELVAYKYINWNMDDMDWINGKEMEFMKDED